MVLAAMKILVGDDDQTTVALIKSALEGGGHQVLVAFDGMQAVRLARLEHPDLIILDIVMPGQDGTLVARNLARMPETLAIPLIFLSSQSPEESAQRGDVSRAKAYLQKPIKVKLLLAEVQRVTAAQQAVSSEEVIGGAGLRTDALPSESAAEGAQMHWPDAPASSNTNEPPPAKFDF